MTTREQMHIGDMSHETAIGILKLMLEAMETYDGISPTPERINAVKTVIEALEQEPKTGHWVKTSKAVMGEGYMWYCDKCEHQVYQDSSRPYPSERYCPNCGIKMVELYESEG